MTRIALFALSIALVISCSPGREEGEGKPTVSVTVAEAQAKDLDLAVHAPASLFPRQQASLASRITAPIKELLGRKGDRVARGALLARLDDRDLQAQRQESLATLKQAEIVAERRGRLFEEGAIAQRDLLSAQTELAQDKARLGQIEAQLEFTELESPFAGTITEQMLYPGDMAQPTSPIFTVADVALVVARGQVPEETASQVKTSERCSFTSDERTGPTVGVVSVVNHAVDPSRRSVEVWCEIDNPSGLLLPGTFGDLEIVTGHAPSSVVVPLAAVQFEEGTRNGQVFVVDKDSVAHKRDVVGGLVFEGGVQILKGLAPKEVVVVEGSYALPDGTTVKAATDTPPPEKGGK